MILFIVIRVVAAMLLIMVKVPIFFYKSAEHMGISNLTGKRVKNVKESAVSDLLLQCDCTINFDHFDILVS